MKQTNSKNQSGYTFVELIIGIAIVALVIVGIVVAAKGLFADQKVDAETRHLQSMSTKIKSYISTSPDASGVSTATAISIKAVNDDAVSGVNVNNKFGGTITFAPATVTTANDAFSITYTGLEKKECIYFTKGNGQNFATVSVNNTSVKTAAQTSVQSAAIEGACNDTGNTIVFTSTKA